MATLRYRSTDGEVTDYDVMLDAVRTDQKCPKCKIGNVIDVVCTGGDVLKPDTKQVEHLVWTRTKRGTRVATVRFDSCTNKDCSAHGDLRWALIKQTQRDAQRSLSRMHQARRLS